MPGKYLFEFVQQAGAGVASINWRVAALAPPHTCGAVLVQVVPNFVLPRNAAPKNSSGSELPPVGKGVEVPFKVWPCPSARHDAGEHGHTLHGASNRGTSLLW
jgi:hypothetical protein